MVYGTLICSTIERYIIYNIKKNEMRPIARAPERPSDTQLITTTTNKNNIKVVIIKNK